MNKGKGHVINHSSKELFVIENDSGRVIVHRLGARRKSPRNVDADGFKRADGKAILFHKNWWKVPNFFTAHIFQVGADILIPASVMIPVGDNRFGHYEFDRAKDWGEELAYVTRIIRSKSGKTVGYDTDKYGRLSKSKGIKLTQQGKLDNVVVVMSKRGPYLRTWKNAQSDDNLTG